VSAGICCGSLAVLILAGSPAEAAPAPPPTFELRSDEIMNLVYQLECLPTGAECPFQALWKERLGWTAADDQALERRRAIKERYSGFIDVDERFDDAPLMFDAPRMIELSKKLLLAAAGAPDIPAYRARLELVVAPADAAELAAIAERFLPRFRRFFGEARPRLRRFARALGPYFADARVRGLVARAMAFYEIPATAPRRLQIELIALPAGWKGPTRGEQIELLSTVEIKDGPAAPTAAEVATRGSITLHEMFHYCYASVEGARARTLAAAFAAADDPGSPAAYSLLNEGVATALGALARTTYLGTRPSDDGAWYRDAAIDSVAKAVLPLLEERLASGQSLYQPGFVPDYLRRLSSAMGRQLERPALRLRTLLTAIEDEHIRSLRGIPAGRVLVGRPLEEAAVREALIRHAEQSGVIMLRGKSLAKLRPWESVLGRGAVEKLIATRARHRAFIQTIARGRHGRIYVLVAEDDEDFNRLGERLIAAEEQFELLSLSP
jgi:hypothetical protein